MEAGLRRQLVFALCVALPAFALLAWLSVHQPPDFGSLPLFLGFVAFAVFVIFWGFPAPQLGHTSLERVAQVAPLLIFGPLEAAWINAVASLVWPLLDRRNNQGPLAQSLIRGLHNAGMFALMILAAGGLYLELGGPVPLRGLDPATGALLVLVAVVMQVINELLFAGMARMRGTPWLRSLSWPRMLFELGTVPLGVFAALLYNLLPLEIILLFVGLLVAVVIVVKGFAETRGQLETRIEQLLAVNRIGRAIGASLILDDLVEMIYRECRKLFRFSAFYLVLYDEAAQELDFRLHHNEQGRQPRKRKPAGEGVLGWIIAHNKPLLIRDWDTADAEIKRLVVIVGETPQSFIGVPVAYGDRVLGAISIQSFTPGTFTEQDRDLLLTFAGQVAVAIANARLYTELEQYKHQLEFKVAERTRELNEQKEELRRLSESLRKANREKEDLLSELERQTKEDSLTGLYNRRYMDNRLAQELKRAERFGHTAALAVADIDRFKVINDSLGHLVGDDVLRVLADILRRQCRAIDVISRYGGEEFVLYFPETPLDNAVQACEKIRGAIEEHDWRELHPELAVTISIGVAVAPPHYEPDALFGAADAKLYEAKRSGRNRVCS